MDSDLHISSSILLLCLLSINYSLRLRMKSKVWATDNLSIRNIVARLALCPKQLSNSNQNPVTIHPKTPVSLLLSFSHPVMSDSLRPHGLQHTKPPYLPEFAQVHVHCIGDAIQPSHLLIPSSPSFNSWYRSHRLAFICSAFYKSSANSCSLDFPGAVFTSILRNTYMQPV